VGDYAFAISVTGHATKCIKYQYSINTNRFLNAGWIIQSIVSAGGDMSVFVSSESGIAFAVVTPRQGASRITLGQAQITCAVSEVSCQATTGNVIRDCAGEQVVIGIPEVSGSQATG